MVEIRAGTVSWDLDVNQEGLIAGLRKSEQIWAKQQAAFRRAGQTLTRSITLPILGIGAASVKTASTFDTEMTKIVTLVGIAEAEVNAWRQSILAIGPAIGRGPTELAKALFVVTSAGARGAEALEIVERAGKAAALGLGETKDIARLVTAALQAYGKEGLTAAAATDTLIAIVRKGNFEASELASVLGRVLGTAQSVGVSFQQAGAFIATFTKLGVPAAEAVTALRGILNSMLRVSGPAAEALAGVGLSADQLRTAVREKGLTAALIGLVGAFKGNAVELANVIPNVRALGGVLGTAGAQANAFAEDAKAIANATGLLDEGFKKIEDKPAQTFAVIRSEIAAVGIELGNQLLPAVLDLAKEMKPLVAGLRDGIQAFSRLTPEQRKSKLLMVGLVAATGPFIRVLGLLVGGLRLSAIAFQAMKISAVDTMVTIKLVSLGAASGMAAFKAIVFSTTPLVGGLALALGAIALGFGATIRAADKAGKALEDAGRVAANTSDDYDLWINKIKELNKQDPEAFQRFKDRVEELRGELKGTNRTVGETVIIWVKAFNEIKDSIKTSTEEIKDDLTGLDNVLGELTFGVELTVEEKTAEVLADLESSLASVGLKASLLGREFDSTEEKASIYGRAVEDLADLGVDIDKVLFENGATLRSLGNEYIRLNGELRRVEDGTRGLSEIQAFAINIQNKLLTPTEQYEKALNKLRIALALGLLTQEEFNEALKEFQEALDSALSETAKTVEETLQEGGVDAGRGLIRGIIQGAEDLADLLERTLLRLMETVVIASIEDIFGIDSPSKVARGWGESIGQGFVMGLGSSAGSIASGLQQFQPPRTSRVAGLDTTTAAARGDNFMSELNFNINANDARGVERFFFDNAGLITGAVLQEVRRNAGIRDEFRRR